jgi:hypothetical protein
MKYYLRNFIDTKWLGYNILHKNTLPIDPITATKDPFFTVKVMLSNTFLSMPGVPQVRFAFFITTG